MSNNITNIPARNLLEQHVPAKTDHKANALAKKELLALRKFNASPDNAWVRFYILLLLFSISRATAWRWIKMGRLPAPQKIGSVTVWRAGDIRQALDQVFDNPTIKSEPMSRDAKLVETPIHVSTIKLGEML